MENENVVFLFGLDNAGKTSLLKASKNEKIEENEVPTRYINIINMIIGDLHAIIWDAPGQVSQRESWKKGIPITKLLVFVLDTSDKDRFKEAKTELDKVLNLEDAKKTPLIVCFHKFDLEESQKNLKEAFEVLNLQGINNREVYWINSSVFINESIEDLKFTLYNLIILKEAKLNLGPIQEKYKPNFS